MTIFKRATVVVSAAVLAFASASIYAQTSNEFGIEAGAAYADKHLNDGDSGKVGPEIGLRFAHFYNDSISWFVDATYSRHNVDLAGVDKTNIWAVRTGPEFWFGKSSAQWFIQPAVGWTELDWRPDKGSRVQASLGFGQRFAVGDKDHFSWTLRADHPFGHNGIFEENVTNYEFLLGYAFGLGGAPKDSDGDGVIDRRDKCPDTPRGATVDANGCPKDSDGDGVLDGIDKCPDTPKGARVDATGCPIDSDGDGVPDGIDQCPDTPKGAKVDAKGCPIDSDGDGVPDGLDRCPDTPTGTKVDANGCPLPPPPPPAPPAPPKAAPLFTEGKKTLVLEGVNFETNKATLLPTATETLDRVAASLRDWPDVNVEIDGHTDSRGSKAHNMKLSEARAESVKQYLVGKGIDASRLTTKGFGPSKPIDTNKTEEGRAKNRRVELQKI